MQTNQKQGKKKIASTIFNIIIWVFVVFSMVVSLVVLSSTAFNNDGTGVPSLGGYSLITVQSDSMKPEFSKGAMIIVKKATAEQRTQYEKDDIITYFDYQADGSFIFVTHRVIKVEELAVTTYTTLGDTKEFDLSGGAGSRVFCNDVLGEYTTNVSGTDARRSNVKRAAAAINNYVMNTGDVFSYNEALGQRTAANGYLLWTNVISPMPSSLPPPS